MLKNNPNFKTNSRIILLLLSLSRISLDQVKSVFEKRMQMLQYQNIKTEQHQKNGFTLNLIQGLVGFCFGASFLEVSARLVRLGRIFWPFQLNLQSLHPDLEPIHSLDCRLGACGVVKADEPEALALVGRPVDEHLRADDVAKGEEHLHELGVAKLLGQVVDEEVAALGTADRAA